MLSYPLEIVDDGYRCVKASCPDFPELNVVVERRFMILRAATQALDEIVTGRMARGEAVPKPSPGQPRAAISALVESRVRKLNAKSGVR